MNMIERIARAIANANGDEFDGALANKSEWIVKRGMGGGRHRDCNEPYRSDYLDMATAAIQAMRDPTPEMIAAGEAVDGTVTALPIWQAMIDATPIDTYEMEPIDTFGVGEG